MLRIQIESYADHAYRVSESQVVEQKFLKYRVSEL